MTTTGIAPLPEIQSVPVNSASGMPIPLSVRQQMLADQLVMKNAGSTDQPIYNKGVGYAKLLAGALGGYWAGSDVKKLEDEQHKVASYAALPLNGAPAASPATPGASGPTSDPSSIVGKVQQAALKYGIDPAVATKVLGIESSKCLSGDNLIDMNRL
jgi:hypothetical protein